MFVHVATRLKMQEDLDLSPTAVSAIFGSDNQGIRNQRSGGSVL
jgi:hypothetical protein